MKKCKCKSPTKDEYLGNQDAFRCKCGGYVSGLEVQRRRREMSEEWFYERLAELVAKNPPKKAIDVTND